MENGVTENQMPEKIAKVEVASSSLVTRSTREVLTNGCSKAFVRAFSLDKMALLIKNIEFRPHFVNTLLTKVQPGVKNQ